MSHYTDRYDQHVSIPGTGRAHPAGRRGAGGEHQRLAFTAVAELAGPAWAGRALGIQNTGQNALAALTPPIVAVLIGAAGYPAAFAVAGVLPLAAAALVPLAAERRAPPWAEAAPAAQAR